MDPTHIGGPAIVGCIHLDPAQLMQLSGVYIWTQPGYSNPTFHPISALQWPNIAVYSGCLHFDPAQLLLQHHQCGDANLESESFKSESLVMSALSLVISYEIVSINSSVL